jgi:hypothetical protein
MNGNIRHEDIPKFLIQMEGSGESLGGVDFDRQN